MTTRLTEMLLFIGIICAVAACSLPDDDNAEDKSKMMQLVDIISLSEVDNSLKLILSGEIGELTLVDGENDVVFIRDKVWLGDRYERGAPVSFDPVDRDVLPAVIAIDVEVFPDEDPQLPSDVKVFGFPRPSLMTLKADHPDHEQLAALAHVAMETKSGAAFAVRDSFFIEDIRLIPKDDAMKMLGLVVME